MTIFVSVASYRDPELQPTIDDCIAKAHWPGELRFGICWQRGPDEPDPADLARNGAKVRRLDVPFGDSKGACWARSRVQRELFNGEDFYLQIDSHHRFVQDWDRILLAQIQGPTMPNKPVLSTYCHAYDIGQPLRSGELPTMMRLDRIEPTGVVLFQAFPVSWARSPVMARFASGHLLFSTGEFVEDVPYDPDLYFTGEEITLAVRAYTHGYDLFHPSEHVIWHEFSRKARPKHWDDHLMHKGFAIPWHVRDYASQTRVLHMLQGHDVGPLGFGTVRTLRDYEAYSGLDFTNWTACADAFRGDPPTGVELLLAA